MHTHTHTFHTRAERSYDGLVESVKDLDEQLEGVKRDLQVRNLNSNICCDSR